MREISTQIISDRLRDACIEACIELPSDVLDALQKGLEIEETPAGRDVLKQLIENAEIARTDRIPICQDTGLALVFIEIGQEVHITGGNLADAVNEGISRGYRDGYLRKSIARHPIDRVNTGDNTPAVIYTDIVSGDVLKIILCPKGGGSENMSAARGLKPSDGAEGIIGFVVDVVKSAGPNPCPPVVLGVGIGGTLDKAALLSKRAIVRKMGEPAKNPIDAELERRILEAVNATGIGPAGLGGKITALAVHVESHPCHIAGLPVAVTIQCHAARHIEMEF